MKDGFTFIVLSLLIAVLAGAYLGFRLGQADSDRNHRKQLTEWGCGGYTYDTGEWTLNEGGTCRIPVTEMTIAEPEQ